jgi:capsular exopolysaccharide synthesis family protein
VSSVENAANEVQPTGLTLADYLRVARVHWKSIVALTAVATIMAFAWTLIQPRLYASESSGIVVTSGADNLSLSLAGDNLAKSKAKNYKSVAGSRLVADRVMAALSIEGSADTLLDNITVEVPTDTAEVRVTARSTDPAMAQKLADAWVVALGAQIKEIESTATAGASPELIPPVRLIALGQAVLPTAPVSPNVRVVLMVGAALGLLLGFAYALLRNYLDRRLRRPQEIERLFGVPVIGTIPVDHRLDGRSAVLEDSVLGHGDGGTGSHAITEALRELRTNLQFIDVDNPPRIIVVTSSVPAEGKSTVTANVAVTLAAAGENVVVVDGDLRRPTVVDVFRLVPGAGVTDVLTGRVDVSDVLQPWAAMPNLHVLGSGRIPPNPSELLGSRAMRNMLKSLAENAIVLIDAPPLLPVTDAAVLARVADGAIVVVRAGKTTQDELGKSLDNLKKAKGHVLGTILNCIPVSGSGGYSYYGSYQSISNDEQAGIPEVDDEFSRLLTGAQQPSVLGTFSNPRSRRSAR